MTAAIQERVARAMSKPLANMYGGCFKPEGRSQRADCADGDCYCARVGRRCASTALAVVAAVLREQGAAIRSRGHQTDTAAEQDQRERLAMQWFRAAEMFGGSDGE